MVLDERQIELCIPSSQLIETIGETPFVPISCKSGSGDPQIGVSCNID